MHCDTVLTGGSGARAIHITRHDRSNLPVDHHHRLPGRYAPLRISQQPPGMNNGNIGSIGGGSGCSTQAGHSNGFHQSGADGHDRVSSALFFYR